VKNKVILIATMLFLSWALLPIPWNEESGVYNVWSGLIWSTSEASIAEASWLHEKGHELDALSGWLSKTNEFQLAVTDIGLDLWDNSQENYAWIYELAHGQRENMPAQLQEFYDWELAEKLLEKYKEKTW